MKSDAWDVLQQQESRSHVEHDALDPRPEPSFVVGALLLSSDGEGLAREARNDEIHASTPRCAVEGFEIVPDRSAIQGLVRHPRHEDGRGIGFPLDVTNGAGSGDGKMHGQVEPADSGAERKDGKGSGTCSHT